MVFMALCYTMAVVFFFYPETVQKSLEEIDLFAKDRNIWVSTGRKARKVGAVVEREPTQGEALTNFKGKGTESVHVDNVEFKAHVHSLRGDANTIT
ncbi:sugar transporter [Penicillium chermesinum]|uniref:Sugar transporter n=1 Tax=Penicillium chermesinum TaxID=63820 RepID=A0A9W9PHE7_9EURO|nr:sugar transporter [Penicillium chermesinum]KAJ5246858.1 sugar transporter [Penicillium chermesinum]